MYISIYIMSLSWSDHFQCFETESQAIIVDVFGADLYDI